MLTKGRRNKPEKSTRATVVGMTFSQVSIFFLGLLLVTMNGSWSSFATTWGTELEISVDGLEFQFRPSIAADKSNVHVVWEDGGGGDSDIFYRHFNGTDWQPVQEISIDSGTGDQLYPAIAVEGDKVHVVWTDEGDGDPDIFYRYFNGTAWQPVQEISTDVAVESQMYPAIGVEADKMHVVWYDNGDGDFDIYYRHFNGTAWEPELELSTDSGIEAQSKPSIAAENGRVHVVWIDRLDGDEDVYYKYFDGTSWQPEQQISTDLGTENQYNPLIAVENRKVHVVWQDHSGLEWDIFYRYYNGTSWQPEQEISTDVSNEEQGQPALAVENDRVYVVWRDSEDGDGDIYYRYFNGTSWQPEEEVSTDSGTEGQSYPSIAAEGGGVHIVWQDQGGGGWDIYYRKGVEDITQPESSANPISPYWQPSTTFDIGWTATDDFDLANISLYYRFSIDNSSWTPWEERMYNNSVSGLSANGIFSITAPYGDGFYEFYTIASDSSGNVEMAPLTADAIAGVDTIPLPPTSINAVLSGKSSENITLTWGLSLDDGAGKSNLERYNIYKGDTYDPSGATYVITDSFTPGTDWFEDLLAGEGDPNNYFYLVCAVGYTGSHTCHPDQAAKFTRSLSQGVNLISIPLIQADESVAIVLQTVNLDKAWSFDSSIGEWKSYAVSKPYQGDLKMLNHTMGIWVNVVEESNLTVAGVVPSSVVIDLHKGWNLVGYPSFRNDFTVANLEANVTSERVEGYDALAPPYFLKLMLSGDVLQTGFGYWVRVIGEASWIIDNS